ncbi:glyoxalase/bleomycin resistance/extradiol dioxygenase family protein [Pleurocapsa sp. CCALA 161]|uniref:VOC family protein n=1 Tax=Pleurocapsa sp. CCALA 161 TaxID=2107688 RepID=UPI000D070566|nr:VOC family protein [Pleurocapsa sp. CCALA 161]PSB09685.1 glyoxalase/bleomycin resistance/extradiol dioxygenase family protein [Pleurocapsa sp. CCALA 161]
MHHASIRTADIHQAIAFYEQLGFTVNERFTTGYTLACWMTGLGGRIELIQIPEPKPAPDAFNDEHYVGYYHLSFDLTDSTPNLSSWLAELEQKINTLRPSVDKIAPLKVLLQPEQQMIGDRLYEVAFIADLDGLPLEFIRIIN